MKRRRRETKRGHIKTCVRGGNQKYGNREEVKFEGKSSDAEKDRINEEEKERKEKGSG